MSKPSRRRQGRPGSTPTGATPRPPATPPATGATSSASSSDETASGASTGPAPSSSGASRTSGTRRPSTAPSGSARTGRRTRATYQQRPFAERHRGTIVGIAAIAGIALIGLFFVYSASRPLFQCTNIWEPTPTASPLPGASPAPGYVQDDMGRRHVPAGEVVKYTYCPPASGNHFIAAGIRPDPRALLRRERHDHPAGLGPQPGARRPGPALSGRQRGRHDGGPTGAQGVLRRLPAQPGLQHHARHEPGSGHHPIRRDGDAVRGTRVGPCPAAPDPRHARDPRVLRHLG